MSAHPRRAKVFFVALLVLAALAIAYAISENRPWKVPEEAKQRPNPIQPSPAALAAAKSIYKDKCANCHGDTGKGDGSDAASYYPKPSDLADPSRMNSVTDGELFYKISQGHKPMPAFKRKLTEEQRWQLVLLLRSFAPSNANPGASKASIPSAH
jgi:mono/diheme cytochrome c family protein